MTKTNLIHPLGWKVSRVYFTALTSAFMFILLLLTSAPTYGQTVPTLVDSDVAIQRIKAEMALIKAGNSKLNTYYTTRYSSNVELGRSALLFSEMCLEVVANHINSGKTTREAVLYLSNTDNVDLDANPNTDDLKPFGGVADSERDRIVREEIIPLLKK